MLQETVVRGSWRNEAARQVLGRYKMPVVAAWNVSVPLWEYHRCAETGPLMLESIPLASFLSAAAGLAKG